MNNEGLNRPVCRVLLTRGEKGEPGEPGVPTQESTQAAVDDWMGRHPEVISEYGWPAALAATPKFADFETVEAKCMAVDGRYLYVCGAYNFQKWDVSCEAAPQLLKTAYPLSGLGMRAYQMALSADGTYLYMAARSTQPGYTQGNYVGGLFTIRTSDCVVVDTIRLNAKASGLELTPEKDKLALNLQLGGWQLYDLSNPAKPDLLFSHRETEGQQYFEYQRGEFYRDSQNRLMYAVAGYIDGIKIWDCSDEPQWVQMINHAEIAGLAHTHVFDLTVDFPKVYCTIAPTTPYASDQNEPFGILMLDVADLEQVQAELCLIATGQAATYKAGDAKPCEIEKCGNKLLLNNGDKGIAVFGLVDKTPVFRGNVPCDGDELHSLLVMQDGRIFAGTAYIRPFKIRIFRGI